MANLLALVTDACSELSLAAPSAVVGNATDNTALRMERILTRTCRQLAARFSFEVLRREHTFTTVALASQATAAEGDLPSDFLRFVPDTMYNRTKRYKVVGPMSPAEWQSHQASLVTRVYDAYTVRANTIYMAPTPTAGQTVAFEYVTNAIATDSAGDNPASAFAADTDLPYLDDELLILGLVWRYRKSEGMDYAEEYRDFENRLADIIKGEDGRRTISMVGASNDRIPRPPLVPDTLTGLS